MPIWSRRALPLSDGGQPLAQAPSRTSLPAGAPRRDANTSKSNMVVYCIHLFICEYMYIYIYMYIPVYIYVCIYLCVQLHVCICICVYTHVYTYTYSAHSIHIYIYMCICMIVYISSSICKHSFIYRICTYIYIYTHVCVHVYMCTYVHVFVQICSSCICSDVAYSCTVCRFSKWVLSRQRVFVAGVSSRTAHDWA